MKAKTVLITGGSSGIGKAIALLFARHGADVAITYRRNKNGARDTVAAIEQMGRKAVALKADLNKDAEAKAAVGKAVQAFGRIDILVNNAGNWIAGDDWNGEAALWIESLKQNLVSAMSMSKYAARIFLKQKSGTIINIASTHGLEGHADSPAYSAAKAGIINLTQSYAELLAPVGGRAISVSPSPVRTGYFSQMTGEKKKELEAILAGAHAKKILEPDEVARRALSLYLSKKRVSGRNFLVR